MSQRSSRRVLSFEQLEDRLTPAVQAFFAGGILTVVGDANANYINVSATGGLLHVTDHGSNVPIQFSGLSPTLAHTKLVVVFGQAGDDHITIDASLGTVPATLFGGYGNDTITAHHNGNSLLDGGYGNDTLTGGGGIDLLLGGFGNDTLDGGGKDGKRDILVGGPGADTFVRYAGENDIFLDFNAAQQDVIQNVV